MCKGCNPLQKRALRMKGEQKGKGVKNLKFQVVQVPALTLTHITAKFRPFSALFALVR